MHVIAHIHDRNYPPLISEINGKSRRRRKLLEHFLFQFAQCSFFDKICIWTSSRVMAEIAEKNNYTVFRGDLLKGEDVSSSQTPDVWDRITAKAVTKSFGTQGSVRVYVDAQYLLLSSETLEKMFDRLMEDEQAHVIYPIYKIDPHLYVSVDLRKEFFPAWDYPGLDRQKYPPLFRKVGAYIHHAARPRYKQPLKELPHIVPWYEGKSYEDEDMADFADYLIEKRTSTQ